MKRQKIRRLLLTISLLLFPITLYYFSPALIFDAGMKGVVNGSFLVFAAMFVLSILFGRLFCAYLCPAGGLQECVFAICGKEPKQGWRNKIKYVIWSVWILAVAVCYISNKKEIRIDFWFETEHGISVSGIQSYVIYYGILCLILIPALWAGKRAFCHYLCWMAPFMVLGTKLGRLLHLPGLHVKIKAGQDCLSCGKCSRACPMGIDVARQVQNSQTGSGQMESNQMESGQIESSECIGCGACIDQCPRHILFYEIEKEG